MPLIENFVRALEQLSQPDLVFKVNNSRLSKMFNVNFNYNFLIIVTVGLGRRSERLEEKDQHSE